MIFLAGGTQLWDAAHISEKGKDLKKSGTQTPEDIYSVT